MGVLATLLGMAAAMHLAGNILQVQFVFAIIAAIIWSFRTVHQNRRSMTADVLGYISLVVVFAVLLFVLVLDSAGPDRGPVSNGEVAFALLSMLSFGILPLITFSAFWFFGRSVGRTIKDWKIIFGK